ncbi:MAG: hypothetical protein WCI04_07070 [archaeon]
MESNIKLQEKALKALISINRSGVISALRANGYNIKDTQPSNDLYNFLIVAMSKSASFTETILEMLKKASGEKFSNLIETEGQSSQEGIISAALTGLGMITNTWQKTAETKANSQLLGTKYTVDGKKTNTLVVAGTVALGIVLLGVMAIVVIKSTKK